MLYKIKAQSLQFLIIVILISSCAKEKNTPEPTPSPNREYELYIDFWNPTGTNPQISFDAENSSSEIRIDFDQTFAGVAVPPNFTQVIIDNVRIIDGNFVNFEIDEITAYEFRNDINNWKEDVEFLMEYEPIGDLNVVLVLDASASLDADFIKVKDFASNFVTKIFTETPLAKIGIVDFSDVINTFPLSGNENAIIQYISNIQQGPFTTLYEAMNTGVDILQEAQSDGKSILTFTDGTDNNSNPAYTSDYLFNKLTNDSSNILINSFTIGLEGNGGVDKPVLENLAANGGVARFPNSISELQVVFEKFSESIANVYNLTYIRNQQIIPDTMPARLKFVFKASPK
ncbi:MAG: VWA domain-containing protein [Bacteroidales bacterium]|nr:VWA domain-containing protein [Bacteroidales bacterium]MCF8403377.1 VWA domain-containing protein [Bacteroidales bacterium]